MSRKLSLSIAAAILCGSAGLALAQTATHDYTSDQMLSYGPKQAAATRAAPSRTGQRPVVRPGPTQQYSSYPDQMLNYGEKSAR